MSEPIAIDRIGEIRKRVDAVSGKPWKFNPNHEMFIGTTNALEMYEDTIDLGRDGKEWEPFEDETGKGYRLTAQSKRRIDRIKSLGAFLERCREDIGELLGEVAGLRESISDHDASFDLRWKSDMRAIKRWQESHPGNDLVWPDHADLCVWLLSELDRLTVVEKS